jgi:hypothetical protein
MLTHDILMDLITMATQSVLVLTLILVASWMLMERAEKRRAERELEGGGAFRVVSGAGIQMMPAYQREMRGGR